MAKPPVVILAAGANTRMFPLNQTEHKGMISLCGQMLIERTIRNLVENDFNEIIVIVSAHNQNFFSHQLAELDLPAQVTVVVQDEAKGMGDAVLAAADHLSNSFFVIAPYHFHIPELLQEMLDRGEPTAVATTHTDMPWQYGIVSLEGDKAVAVTEKPAQGTEASSQKVQVAYMLNQKFLSILKDLPVETYNFETALNQLMQSSSVAALQLNEALPSLKYPWQLFDFQAELFTDLENSISPDADIADTAIIDTSQGPVVIEAGAKVGDFAKIVGPAYIGKNVLVGDYAFVRHSNVEANASVGAKTEIVRSILLEEASIHFGYLADSIVGRKVRIGAGLITANKRFDRAEISVMVKDDKVKTGRTNLGVIIGEQASLGIAVCTMPGVLIGAQAMVFPNVTVYDNLPHHAHFPEKSDS